MGGHRKPRCQVGNEFRSDRPGRFCAHTCHPPSAMSRSFAPSVSHPNRARIAPRGDRIHPGSPLRQSAAMNLHGTGRCSQCPTTQVVISDLQVTFPAQSNAGVQERPEQIRARTSFQSVKVDGSAPEVAQEIPQCFFTHNNPPASVAPRKQASSGGPRQRCSGLFDFGHWYSWSFERGSPSGFTALHFVQNGHQI